MMDKGWPSGCLAEFCMHDENTELSNRDQIRINLPKENAKTIASDFYNVMTSVSEFIKFSELSRK